MSKQKPPRGLLDMPLAFQRDLLAGLWPQGNMLITLSRTCRGFRDTVLSHLPGVHLTLKLCVHQQNAAAACLALAQSVCEQNVHLTLEAVAGQEDTALAQLMALFVEAASRLPAPDDDDDDDDKENGQHQGFTAISKLTLKGKMLLNQMVPDILVTNCPNLTSLHLDEVILHGLDSTEPVIHPQLEALTLDNISTNSTSVSSKAVSAQLRSLPRLKHLSITEPQCLGDCEDDAWDLWLSQPAWVVHQLQTLCLEGPSLEQYQSWHGAELRPWMCVFPDDTVCPDLRQLRASLHLADNEDIQLLLRAAPTLTDLCVLGMFPDSPITEVPCSWAKLSLRDVSAEHLAWLPITKVQNLLMTGENIWLANTGEPELDMKLTLAATSAITACGGLRSADGTQGTVQVWCSDVHTARLRQAALPLLLNLTFSKLRLIGATPLSRTCMTLVGYKESINCIAFVNCGWEDDLMPDLSEVCGGVERFEFCRSIPSMHDVAACVRQTTRPVTFQFVKLDLARVASDWEHQLNAAMAVARQYGVSVELLEDYSTSFTTPE